MLAKILDSLELKILWKTPGRALRLYEAIPPQVLQSLRLMNLKKVLTLVTNKSIFYSRVFQENPFSLKSVESPKDLKNIFTTPKDLQTKPLKHFACNTPQTAFETTGTLSKQPKRVLFSYREIEDAGRVGAAGLWRLGIRPTDKVASSFDYSFWVSGPTLKASLHEIGAFHVEAGRINPEEFYERIKPYGCNIIVADPGWLVRLSEIAQKRGPWMMKFIMIGGENLTESARKFIESVWQCQVILTYGQTEAFGIIGAECQEQNGYHINDMDLWPEIINADENGYGDLVYTTLRRTVMPLIRYKSGDITKILTDPCPCGARSPRLAKLKGRIDDMVVTSVGNIASWMMTTVIENINQPIQEWQLHLKRQGSKDLLELNIEIPTSDQNQKTNHKTLERQILTSMETHMPTAHTGLLQGLAAFTLVTHPSGTLKGTARKLKHILDSRNF